MLPDSDAQKHTPCTAQLWRDDSFTMDLLTQNNSFHPDNAGEASLDSSAPLDHDASLSNRPSLLNLPPHRLNITIYPAYRSNSFCEDFDQDRERKYSSSTASSTNQASTVILQGNKEHGAQQTVLDNGNIYTINHQQESHRGSKKTGYKSVVHLN